MAEYVNKELGVDAGYLSDWYISSVGEEPPVWTDGHIEELLNDFYIIPKESATTLNLVGGDFVDRNSVMDLVVAYCPDDDGSCSKPDTDLRELLDEIEGLPSNNYWVRCSHKLPENDKPVLICTVTGHRVTALYDMEKKVFTLTELNGIHYDMNTVTWWMSIPDAPQE